MGKRSICLMGLCVVLGLVGSASAALVAHWRLDDGSGTMASDSSGNGYDGTLIGGPEWVAGTDGGALAFDGADDYVDFGNPPDWPAGTSPRTLCGWGKTDSVASGYRWMAAYGSPATGQAMFIGMNGSTLVVGGYGGDDVTVSGAWQVDEWYHVALTYNGTTAIAYVNGVQAGSLAKSWDLTLSRAHLGRQVNNAAEFWDGLVDDVRLYDTVLTAAEIKALVPPKLKARKPVPADGATGVITPLFQWTAGDTALWHNVYLSTSADLTEADLVGVRLPFTMHYHIAGLESGTTYYWRVDEIEADGTVHTGDVWALTTAPLEAFEPIPADGAKFQDLDVDLAWTAGVTAASHDVYFGTDEAAVADGTGDTFQGNQADPTFEPGPLTVGTVYYWRVDEVEQGGTTHTGDVWRFTTLPEIAISDPNLVGWWTFDEGAGTRAIDRSGHGVHGDFRGDPQWVPGAADGGLELNGSGDYVDFGSPQGWPAGAAARSLCGWGKTDTVATGWRWIAAYGSPVTSQAMFIGLNGTSLYGGGYGDDVYLDGFWEVDEWHHICLTYDGATARLYADALQVVSAAKTWNLVLGRAHIGRQVNTAVEFWDGTIDDVRVYNKALTPDEIRMAMRGNPLRAWGPDPSDDAIVDIRTATPLTWSPGDNAVQHDVYLGTDEQAVDDADASDTSGVYRSRLSATSYTPPEGLLWGQPYAWRVDEIGDDGTVTKGAVWTFTVADYLIVDDFESYTDEVGSRIFQTWLDGWGYTEPEVVEGNGTGATVGYLQAPFAEQTIVYTGRQSMPLDYNNAVSPWYSEAERTWPTPQDWTFNEVDTLTLYFRGNPVSFIETAPNTITMSAAGNDIWNEADQCRFAYKRLNGNGSIVVRVDSLLNTNAWAKAGVMIRETLDAGSAHAAVVVTPGNGVSFPRRPFANGASEQIGQTGITAPHWVKLTRTGETFTAEHSADGTAWTSVGPDAAASSDTISMASSVLVGLCLTSHNVNATTTAEFSNVQTAGGVSGQWQVAEIGADHPGNTRDDLYLVVQDSAGRPGVAVHPDPDAVLATEWTEWKVPLSDLTAAGVSVTSIKKMYIGVGDRDNPTPSGAGMLYIDDIRVTRSGTP